MIRKALWVYLGLYGVGAIILEIVSTIQSIAAGEFHAAVLIGYALLLLPVVVAAMQLYGRKVSILFTLLALLCTAVPLVGIFNFNEMSLATIGKAMIFIPMAVVLLYFAYVRLFKRERKAAEA